MCALADIEIAVTNLQAECDKLEVNVNMLGYGGDRTAAKELADQQRELKSKLEHQNGRLAAEKESQAIAAGILVGVPVAPRVANQIRVFETQLHAVGQTLARARGRLDEILAEDPPTA